MDSGLAAFKEEVDKLATITQKAVESIQVMVARQNAFIQSIDNVATNVREFMTSIRTLPYGNLKLADNLQEDNDAIANVLEAAANTCQSWYIASNFISMNGGNHLDEEMEGILLQTRGLQELFARRWEYLV